MRFYHYILLFLLIAVIGRAYYLFFRKDPVVIEEGFESLESCLTQGYPTRFCKRVPIQSYITGAS
jgi:hypothetical protein